MPGTNETGTIGAGPEEGRIHYITTNGIGNAWVAAELEALRTFGLEPCLHSMRESGRHFFRSDWAKALDSETRILYPLPTLPFLWNLLCAPFRFGPRLIAAKLNALFGERENLRGRVAGIAHLMVACHWAASLRKNPPACIHSHWIHSCGTIGMYASWLLDVPFSFTGHAVDLFRDRVALHDKIRRADLIVCISEFHREFYLEHGARPDQLIVVHCGIDVDQFEYQPIRSERDVPHVVTVGRLVEKKGLSDLIAACGLLKRDGAAFKCTIAGDGPLEETLRAQVEEEGLGDCVLVTGKAVLQEDLAEFLHSGDIFAQPCVWSSDNDVDGTPRTLMEAMACGVPSISTRLAGIPDIIEDGVSGLLVEPGDAEGLADAIRRVANDRALAAQLSEGGRRKIEADWRTPDCVRPLEQAFRERFLKS